MRASSSVNAGNALRGGSAFTAPDEPSAAWLPRSTLTAGNALRGGSAFTAPDEPSAAWLPRSFAKLISR